MTEKGFNLDKSREGYFLFTLDTELAWGHFDNFTPDIFSQDGQRERNAIIRILDILDEFNIAATWALVGHLFYSKCEKCEPCPVLAWRGRYSSFEEIYDTSAPLWYGADIMEILLGRSSRHEIAFHGYTHRIFNKNIMTEDDAKFEIEEWLRVVKYKNMSPKSVVFPRNKVGFLDIFKQKGFVCYRGAELMPKDYYVLPIIGKVLNRIDLIFQIRAPQLYDVPTGNSGLVNLPASRSLLRTGRKVDAFLKWVDLGKLHIQQIIRGVHKAAREKKVIHIYTHPYEFRADSDFEKLRQLLREVSKEVNNGRIKSITMAGLAAIANKS